MHRQYYPSLEKCPNATEQRLIQNRLKQTLLDNDICPRHRMKYGLGWPCSQKCQYSAEKIMKVKRNVVQITDIFHQLWHLKSTNYLEVLQNHSIL